MNPETLELLRQAHNEPIADAHYAAVRARVLSRIIEERRKGWRLWASGLAAALMLASIALWWKHIAAGPPLKTAGGAVEQARLASPVAVPTENVLTRGNRLPRRRPAPAGHEVVGPPVLKPLVVKLITSDPDVVIYWISGE